MSVSILSWYVSVFKTTLARPLSAGRIIIESSCFKFLTGFLHFFRDVGLERFSLLNNVVNSSPYGVCLS